MGCLDACGLAGCRVPHHCPSRTPSRAMCCLKRMFLPAGAEKGSEPTSVPESSSQANPLALPQLSFSPITRLCTYASLSGWFPIPPLSLDTGHPTPLQCMGVQKEPPKAFIVCGRFNRQYKNPRDATNY